MSARSKYARGLEGRHIGAQTIVRRVPNRNGAVYWIVRCECGHERPVHIAALLQKYRYNCCVKCAAGRQTGPNSPKWRGGRHTPLTTYNKFKRSAERRKITWGLSISDIDALYEKQRKLCALSLEPLTFDHGLNGVKGNASLDRTDSSGGYTIDNIQLITKKLNVAKQSFSYSEFVEMCIAVTNAHLE